MDQIYKLTEVITGARRGEIMRTIACFLAMFLLLTSYYTIKPLRNSMLNREFSPDSLKDLFLAIPFISLFFTRVFNWFYDRLPKFKLIFATYGVFIACKIGFMLALPQGGKIITLVFYFWITVYFLLAISILWGTISTIFKSEAGERVYPFISFGAMTGAMVGSWLCGWLAKSPFKSQTLLVSAMTMGVVLAFLALALRHTPDYVDKTPAPKAAKAPKPFEHNVFHDLLALWKNRYVRAIGIMIFAMSFMNLVIEFRSQKEIDLRLSERSYLEQFGELNAWRCQQQACKDGLDAEGFDTISKLRLTEKAKRQDKLQDWLNQQKAPFQAAALLPAYEKYQDGLDGQTQSYLANINLWINIIGVGLLLFVARPMFQYLGVRKVLLQLPLIYMLVAAVLFYPVGLEPLGIIMILTGTMNYSLNKTAKELLYTQADDEARFRFKPLIDGPIVRMGDVSAAILSKVSMDLLLLSGAITNVMLLIAGIGMSGWWLFSSYGVGKDYEERKAGGDGARGAG